LNNNQTKIVVFADLDGSVLDESFDYEEVIPIIDELLALGASVVFNSSKTRAEIQFYNKKIGINEPFIVENGSAVFMPKGYFSSIHTRTKQLSEHDVIELGVPYWLIRQKLSKIRRKTNAQIVGFGDLTAKEISASAGLPFQLAKLAKQREYDEPFLIVDGREAKVVRAIEKQGLCCTEGGRYLHMLGDTDKGKAVAALSKLYFREFGKVLTLGVGDSANDLSMLEQVDAPFFVNGQSGKKAIVATWQKMRKFAKEAIKMRQMLMPLTSIPEIVYKKYVFGDNPNVHNHYGIEETI
jgi:mannosyl-3-phosphoglycerate phosphatase